jgi:multiple sugar transport system substrate-binding protein
VKKYLSIFLVSVIVVLLVFFGSFSALAEKITITAWHGAGGGEAKGVEEVVEKFNKQQDKIEVKLVFVEAGSVQIQKSLAAIAAGTPPDLILLAWPQYMGPLHDALVPLDRYIAQDSKGYAKDDFIASHLLLGNSVIKGRTWGMPAETNNLALYYNKELFKQGGVTPPKTWKELVEVAQKLTNPDKKQWGLSLPTGVGEGLTWTWMCFLWQAGGTFTNPEQTKLTFNTPAGVEALQFWVDLIHKYNVATLTPPQNAFLTGNVAMEINGPWSIPTIRTQSKVDLGIAPLPMYKRKATNIGGTVNIMFKTTEERQKATWEFMKYFSGTEAQAELGVKAGFIPVRKSSLQQPIWKEYVKEFPDIQVHIDSYEFGRYRPYGIVTYDEISQILSRHLQAALYQKESSKEALDKAVQEAQPKVKGW